MAVNETPLMVIPWNCTIFWEKILWAGSRTAPHHTTPHHLQYCYLEKKSGTWRSTIPVSSKKWKQEMRRWLMSVCNKREHLCLTLSLLYRQHDKVFCLSENMQQEQFHILVEYGSSKTVSSLWFPGLLGKILVTDSLFSHTQQQKRLIFGLLFFNNVIYRMNIFYHRHFLQAYVLNIGER